ncbi:hypothetical protein NYO98_06480 [Nocardioides sp. STR2]|uniref:Serine esterase n=1 Tax=Nocardioides pini TaxID=2975053 RepID=A0ABT4CAB6_9ACTN|nr:hypothetical protein [Nocardioides pini]MCY4725918.1 hypothetical protein [Nocardioides pini]
MHTFDIEFTKDGEVFDSDQKKALFAGLDATDLLVLSHGWNNDVQEATDLYDELLGNIDRLLGLRANPQAPATLRSLEGRTFMACRVFWPSKKFADEDLIPGGGAASASTANDAALERTLDSLAEEPERLGQGGTTPIRQAAVAEARALVPQLDADEGAQKQYVNILRSLVETDDSPDDDGTSAFFGTDGAELFQALKEPVVAPGPAPHGGAAVTAGGAAGADQGGAAGLRDLIAGGHAAARRLANYATYLRMKSRAGTVGTKGLGPLLRDVRQEHSDIRLHLVGHSFGGRLVTAAANALDDDTPYITLSLLQAAFSHNGLSADFGEGKPGAFHAVVGKRRASGPIIITHTKKDRAVGVAYPLASRITFQNAAALGDKDDPYGGMGRNGAQRTKEATGNETKLAAVGHGYAFQAGKVYNLLADDFISHHGDVKNIQVAYAILSAVAAG